MASNISTQIESWRAQLLDTTKRNRLINFKAGRGGGILLSQPAPGTIWRRLVCEGQSFTFPWKRDLIDTPGDAADETGVIASDLADRGNTTGLVNELDILDRCRRSPDLHDDHILTELPDKQLATR